ncbi:hypothetical protein GEV33_003028 [Tenebrio molitor]|uniref:Uncharacterized protein n=1 Tax=Tenebrio molitor TaxID=7067 RepID=A0A8J6HT55_TENMO|nr:hypothetical protein GEV33_003028 [Tenebrio molitor]
MYVGTQCDILCDNLKNIKGADYNKKLIICIQHHKIIVEFAKDCNIFFNMMVLGQFFVTSMSAGLAMFQLTLVPQFSSECYFLLFYVGSITVQIFVYCWFGNEVEFKVNSGLTPGLAPGRLRGWLRVDSGSAPSQLRVDSGVDTGLITGSTPGRLPVDSWVGTASTPGLAPGRLGIDSESIPGSSLGSTPG